MIFKLCLRFAVFFASVYFGALTLAAEADYDTLIQQSLQARNQGDFALAEERLMQARPLARDTNEVSYLLGMVLAFQERFIEAMSVIDEGLERYPDDIQLTLAKARVLTYQGIFSEATDIAQRVVELDSSNLEARNLLARTYVYQRRYSDAREAYATVLAVDPANLEALIGLFDTGIATGDQEAAQGWLEQAAVVAPAHIDVLARQQNLAPPIARPHLFSAGFSESTLDLPGLPDWYDRFAEYRYLFDSGSQAFIRSEHSHRFGDHNSLTEIGALIENHNFIPVEIAIAYTDDASFFPESRISLGTVFGLNSAADNFGATTMGVNVAQSKYVTGNVTNIGLDFTHYLLNANAWLTPSMRWLEDEDGDQDIGWSLGSHWQTTARLRIGYTYFNAPDTENGVTVQTSAHHVYFNYQINDSVGLRMDASSNDRENAYTRDTIGLSLQLRY